MPMQADQSPVVQNWKTLLANVSLQFLSWNMENLMIFVFAEKNVNSVCLVKATHIFAAKYQCIWKYLSYNG